ncbi:hypothetical protein C7N43_22780 [Sphingobacteriales bacterium UPWRP_1]|nr:hypothetical protein B6N25_14835 [Sphingobacteriales bacterium TSM_CSS]PSJ74668.1 hypothetical protein C7N43_22780 [Sphingobacteriales bacterium UPWRP_1]
MYKKVISASVVYTLLTFMQPMLSLLLQPFYLKWFSNAEYAVFSLMNSYSSLVTLLSTLGIGAAVYTCYYDYSQKPEELKRYMGQVLSFCLWANLLFAAIIFVLGQPLFSVIFRAEQAVSFYPYGAIATICGMAGAIAVPYTVFLRNGNLLKQYAWLTVITAFGATFAQLAMVMVFHAGLSGALWGKTTGMAAGALMALGANYRLLTLRLNQHYLRDTVRFMRFSTPNSIVGWMYLYFDRFLTERLLNLTIVSMYSLLHVLTSTIEMAYLAVRGAITPFIFEALSPNAPPQTEQQRNLIYRFYFGFTILFASAVVAVVCNLQLLTSNTSYYAIRPCVFLYASGYIAGSLADIANIYFYHRKQSLILLLYTLFAVAVNIALNVALMPAYGLWGIIIASVATRLLFIPVLFIPNPKLLKPFLNKLIYLPLTAALAIMGLAHAVVAAQILRIELVGILQFLGILLLLTLFNLPHLKNGLLLAAAFAQKPKFPLL